MHPHCWLFTRHAQSEANRHGRLEGHSDSPLTSRGQREARDLGVLLAQRGLSHVLCSPLARTQQTAALAAPGLRVHVVPELIERCLGEWEGLPRDRARAAGHMTVLTSWSRRPPGGESQRDVARRVLGWLAKWDRDEGALVVAHAGVIRAVLGRLDGLERKQIGRWRVPHAQLLERHVQSRTWSELYESILEES